MFRMFDRFFMIFPFLVSRITDNTFAHTFLQQSVAAGTLKVFLCVARRTRKIKTSVAKNGPKKAKQLLKCWRETSLSCCSFLLVSHSSFAKAMLGTYRMLNLLCKKQLEHACLQHGILLSEPSLSTHLDAFLLIYFAIYTLGILLQVE